MKNDSRKLSSGTAFEILIKLWQKSFKIEALITKKVYDFL
jgi:hypothetical protein